jgi:hypothetical protein
MIPENPDQSIDQTTPMTLEQKFFFDLRGWIVLPAVLKPKEIEEMKAEVYGELPRKVTKLARPSSYCEDLERDFIGTTVYQKQLL